MEDSDEDIAVVGIGCNFPGGEGIDNFWKVLVEGKNCTVQIPEERFDTGRWYDPDRSKAGKSITDKAALIEGFDEFDHKFFGIPGAEADYMDPQQKLLLECAYRALENAGVPIEKASGSRTGVFLGLMNRDYETLLNNSPRTISHYNSTGTAMSIAANRISYTFNLTGPSFAIDSACSSSLVALHSACQAIRQGDCEMALCGGVSCIIEPRVFVALSKAKMISPEGTSKPFSSRADGYGRGEGCGIVLLKPLKDALKDFDHVWGIIMKTAVNQDGRLTTPITKPSLDQQEELLRRVYSAQIEPGHIQYVEAHGTGTPVGDSTEAQAISKVIAKARPPGSEALCIGSVKGNIGHAESAAGMAGLIKVLLMMRHEVIVPSLFYSKHSAGINTEALDLRIPTKAEKWEGADSVGRVAGINSFGFGGTNAHAVVRQYMQRRASASVSRDSAKLIVLSAATEKSLIMTFADTSQKLSACRTADLRALAYTSACRRSHTRHKHRKVFVTSSLGNLQAQLESSLSSKILPWKSVPRIVFVFCGNGVTYSGMCRQLMKREPVFREKVEELGNLFQTYKITHIVESLEENYEGDDNTKPHIVQPLLFTIQVAISSLLKHWGVRPDAVLGHSVGEVAAAHCSGLLSLEDAVRVIYVRSTLQTQVTGGKMLAVSNVEVSEVVKCLPACAGKISLAAVNSPQSCTLSGDADALESLQEKLQTLFGGKNLFLRILDVPAAYHSHMMDPILAEIENCVGTLRCNEMKAELFSTVTGKVCSQMDFLSGTYWARNIREPVAFEEAVKSAAKECKNVVFVEIGPRRSLQRNIVETLGNDTTVLTSVQPDKDHETLLTLVSKLFEMGVDVDWDQFYGGCEALPTTFPLYQFDRPKKKVYFEAIRRGNDPPDSHHPLILWTTRGEVYCNLSAQSYIQEHKHNGSVVVPAAVHVELALASFVGNGNPKKALCSLELNIGFQNLLVLVKNSPEVKVKLQPEENETKFKIYSTVAKYATGTIRFKSSPAVLGEPNIMLDSVFRRCRAIMTAEQVYGMLSQAGFEYGPAFRQLGNVHYGEELKEAVAIVKPPQTMTRQLNNYCLHPVLLDCFLQMTTVVNVGRHPSRPAFPCSIGCVTVSRPLQEEMAIYLKMTLKASDYFEVCGCFTDKEGRVLVELRDVRVKLLGEPSDVIAKCFFHNELRFISEELNPTNRAKALVFEDPIGVAKALQEYLDPKSTFLPYSKFREQLDLPLSGELCDFSLPDDIWDFEEVLVMWGIQDLSSSNTERILENLTDCCEFYRQVLLEAKKGRRSRSVRVITFRLGAKTVDRISPGFTLSGMTRSCAAEISDISFQLIDMESTSREDVRALAHVISSYQSKKFPEVAISNGQIYSPAITRTPFRAPRKDGVERRITGLGSESFVLQTADAYEMTNLSAIPSVIPGGHVDEQTVEVQLDKVCVHSSDYYPVSVSHLKFGQTVYWEKQTSRDHTLLALDFSGTVTAVGRCTGDLEVGDHVASCYPVTASSKVVIPEAACYKTQRLPFLQEVPCVSYFVLSWEIFHNMLPKGSQQKMGIFSADSDSRLVQILVRTANGSGWIAVAGTESSELTESEFEAFVFLPPFNSTWVAKACQVSTVTRIVLVGDDQGPSPPNAFRNDNENVYVQSVQVTDLLQKANLKKQKGRICKWLKSMWSNQDSLNMKPVTFQRTSEGLGGSKLQRYVSYFSLTTMPVIVLDGGGTEVPSDIRVLIKPENLFKKNSVYVVTGGLSGLGLETVKFIAQRGGQCIATLSRRASPAEVRLEMDNLQSQHDVSIMSVQCDVSVSEQVLNAVSVIAQRFPLCPIRGVFHSAVVLHDGLIETLDKAAFEEVLRPKVSGVLNLHYATRKCELDYFVCYSSISSFIGNACQTNYAAANSFLDLFCQYRRNLGLAGQSINWGALNLGLLQEKEHFQRFLEAKGMAVMEGPEIHESLERCLLLNNPQQVVCKFNFNNLKRHVFSQNGSLRARLFALVEEEMKNINVSDTAVRKPTSSFSSEEYVKSLLSETCSVDPNELRGDTAVSALGVDSMLAMTLQNLIFQDRGVNIPLVKLLDPNTTLSTLLSLMNEGSQEIQ
ncbi:hypothetical protein GN956_G14764 [Arapaima gigas]